MRDAVKPKQANEPAQASEKELIARAQAGDPNAFENLIRRHGARVYAIALRMCHGQNEEAEETSQNAFLKAYRYLGGFRGESQFSTWLIQIVINECLLLQRRLRRERFWVRLDGNTGDEEGDEETLPLEIADPAADVEEEFAQQEFQTVLESCLAKVPETYRSAFVLRFIEGLPQKEVAVRLGVSLPAVKSRIHRVRLRLQRCLTKRFCRDGHCYWPRGWTARVEEAVHIA